MCYNRIPHNLDAALDDMLTFTIIVGPLLYHVGWISSVVFVGFLALILKLYRAACSVLD